MNREQHLDLADEAVTRAERLAGIAERAARDDSPSRTAMYAEAATAWSDIARTHAAIAAAQPANETGGDRG
ncbi:hypothetical protein ACIQ9J_25970 [Streptomyces sp. NPDC094153]|uniref:hypothetical protein n=1 Tax=Streptomyces sp. NPDC094153 TaxID=3366058 RepID=UPI003828F14B